jgi:hypothetical protein
VGEIFLLHIIDHLSCRKFSYEETYYGKKRSFLQLHEFTLICGKFELQKFGCIKILCMLNLLDITSKFGTVVILVYVDLQTISSVIFNCL